MANCIISIDLGGTRIRGARMDESLKILERHETYTLASEGLQAVLERIKQMIREVWPQNGDTVMGVGVSAPGPLDPKTGVIVAPPNLPGWHNVPLGDILTDAFNVPVYVGNDANVAALAESLVGAAQDGYRHVIYLTQSTGVGSGIIVDGRMLLGKRGLAAEAGHMPILYDADERVSTVELEAAGPGMARRARARIEAGESSLIVDLVEGDLTQITGSTVGKAAQQGDPLALEVVTRSARVLGLGVVSLLHLFNPEIVVIGGGVTALGDLIFNPVRETVSKYVRDPEYIVPIVPSVLGEDVSVFGAGALVPTKGGIEDIQHLREVM
jgi:glucokinase